MKSFELQTYKNHHWTILSFFKDKDLALFAARRCAEGNPYSAVRVIEENHVKTNKTPQIKVIFSTGLDNKIDKASREEENAAGRKTRLELTRQEKARREQRLEAALGEQNSQISVLASYAKIILLLLLILLAGLAALWGLQEQFLSR